MIVVIIDEDSKSLSQILDSQICQASLILDCNLEWCMHPSSTEEPFLFGPHDPIIQPR